MTLIIGFACTDGVLIASDGMASQTIDNNTPLVGITNLKTNIIRNNFIMASCGDDDLMTLFLNFLNYEFDKILAFKESTDNPDFFMKELIRFYNVNYLNNLYNTANGNINHTVNFPNGTQIFVNPHQQIVNRLANNCLGILFSFEMQGKAYLYHSNMVDCTMIRQDGGIWYSIIGSGFQTASASMHLIKRMLKINKMENIQKTSLLAYWVMSHSIDASPAWLGYPITMAALEINASPAKISYIDNTGAKEYMEDLYSHVEVYIDSTPTNSKIPNL